MSFLELQNVSKTFGNKQALKDFSLEINRGEIFGLLGTRESGKTSVLLVVNGDENVDSGAILFDGNDISKSSAESRKFGFIGNSNPSNEQGLFSKLRKSFEKETSTGINNEASWFGLLDNELSREINLLLLDSPFSLLYRTQREKLEKDLRKKLNERNLTTIFATNDFGEGFAICDRIAVIEHGEILQIGTPREIYESPNCVAVAKLVGRNNLITARRISFNNQDLLEFQTTIGEHRLRVDKLPKEKLGAITDDVTLTIRPENIIITFGASFPEDNLLKAMVTDIHYSGATTRLTLDSNGLKLEVLLLRVVGLNVGDECMIALPTNRILVLKD